MAETWKPVAAGILDIFCGAGAVVAFGLTLIMAALAQSGSMAGDFLLTLVALTCPAVSMVIYMVAYVAYFAGADADQYFFALIAAPFALLGILAVIGGIMAIMRKRWGLSLAGAIAGLVCNFIPGLIATVLTAVARSEFK